MKVTAQDVAQLMASRPPRDVPPHVMRAAQGLGPWGLMLFGLLFGGFGIVFATQLLSRHLLDDVRFAWSPVATVDGRVTHVESTSLRINKRRVIAYDFSYAPPGATVQSGRAYITAGEWTDGDRVTVEYLAANPAVARIQGARLTPGGAISLVILIFPLIGVGVMAGGVVSRRRTARLLREGATREVDILGVEVARVGKNNHRVYRITVSHPTDPAAPPVRISRNGSREGMMLQERCDQKRPIYALYDPAEPTRLCFPEAWIAK